MKTANMSIGPIKIRLITLNVRFATKKPVVGEEPWSVRCPKVCAQLKFLSFGQSSVFVCLQEVLYSQLSDIRARLGPSWDHIGQGREDGAKAGEFSPVFYRTDTWTCERSKMYWLSKTPDVPSRGWDAALERVVTVGAFRHKDTGTAAIVMSTHLDHLGKIAQEESAKLLVRIAGDWVENSSDEPTPLFLGGDFNSTPDDEAYKMLTSPVQGMKDVAHLVPKDLCYGNDEVTYTSFGEPGEEPKRIDFLFIREPRSVAISMFAVLPNRFDDKIYLSDHRPVVADMEILAKVARIS